MPHTPEIVMQYKNTAGRWITDTSSTAGQWIGANTSSASTWVVDQTSTAQGWMLDKYNQHILGKETMLIDPEAEENDSGQDVNHNLLGVKSWKDKRAFVVPGATGEKGAVAALIDVDWLTNTACNVPKLDMTEVGFTNSTSTNLSEDERKRVFGHLRVWRHVIEHELDYALVVEEDVNWVVDKNQFDRHWASMFDTIKNNEKAHIIQLQVSSGETDDPVWLPGQDLEARPHFESELTSGIVFGSGMYFITNTGARHLAKRLRKQNHV